MRRKIILTAIIAVLVIIVWVYYNSASEFHKTVLIFKSNNYFIKDTIIEPSHTICKNGTFLVIIVTSYVGHVELRSAHRRAMPPDLLDSMNATRIFLLARIPKREKYITQEAIKDESDTFGDILQGTFLEHYRNLTHKHLMGLQWTANICHKATFILKVDDDTVFNLESTYKLLLNLSHLGKDLLMGYMLNNTMPKRQKQNKWYVTQEEYERQVYPPYLSGWYYITTPSIAAAVGNEAIHHPYFWIDDIFVTGILTEKLNIKLSQLPNSYWLEYYELLECCLTDMIKKHIKCDYVVGPNGGRNNLIYEFNEAVRNCDRWKNCISRAVDQNLNKICITFRERSIFSDGQAQVEYVKLK